MKYFYKLGLLEYTVRKRFLSFLILIDLIGYLFIWPFLFWKRRNSPPNQIKNILIIRLEHIGDVLLSTPVFRNVKKKYPKAKLTVLVRPFTADVLKNNPYIDEIMKFNPTWINLVGEKGNIGQTISLIKQLRKRKFDLGIDLRGHPMNILLLFLVVKYSIGYGINGLGFLLSRKASYEPKQKHIIERYFDVIKPLSIEMDYHDLDLIINKEDQERVAKVLEKNAILKNEDFMVIHPGTSAPIRFWGVQNFAKLIKKIKNNYSKIKIILVGGRNDKEIIEKISNELNNKNLVINLAEKLTIQELFCLIKRAKALVCLNSLACHLGALAKTPQVVIFSGDSDKNEFSPYQGKNVVIQKKLDCLPCRNINCQDNQCMKQITVQEVFEGIKLLVTLSPEK